MWVLNFHKIVRGDEVTGPFEMTRSQFAALLDAIAVSAEVVPLGRVEGEGLRVALTFDDGNASDWTVVAPMLADRGWTATFCVVAHAEVDGGRLRELVAAGHEVGAHGVAHRALTAMRRAEWMRDLACSKARIESHTQQPCTTFALPYGLYFPVHIRHALDLGYQRVLTTSARPNPNPTAPLIHRLNAKASLRPERLQALLQSERAAHCKALEGRVKFGLRRGVAALTFPFAR